MCGWPSDHLQTCVGLYKSRQFKGRIHLLPSDFQMSGMSGVDLATAMTIDRPDVKVRLMSVFKDGMLILNEGWHFLNKPFVASQLKALVTGLVDPETEMKMLCNRLSDLDQQATTNSRE
jgi:DNA-binding NtrC family response regulator